MNLNSRMLSLIALAATLGTSHAVAQQNQLQPAKSSAGVQSPTPGSGMDMMDMKSMKSQMEQMRTQMDQMQTLMKDSMAKMAAADAAMKTHMETEQASMKSQMDLQHAMVDHSQTLTDHLQMMADHMAMMMPSSGPMDMHKAMKKDKNMMNDKMK